MFPYTSAQRIQPLVTPVDITLKSCLSHNYTVLGVEWLCYFFKSTNLALFDDDSLVHAQWAQKGWEDSAAEGLDCGVEDGEVCEVCNWGYEGVLHIGDDWEHWCNNVLDNEVGNTLGNGLDVLPKVQCFDLHLSVGSGCGNSQECDEAYEEDSWALHFKSDSLNYYYYYIP